MGALGYSRYMATAKRPLDTLAASLRHQHKRIDEMRASARMRARLMKKVRPVEFPPGVVEVTNPGRRQSFALVGGATAAAPWARALTLARWRSRVCRPIAPRRDLLH